MNVQEVFEQFCENIKDGNAVHGREKLVTLLELISYEEFLNKFSNYNYMELIQAFNKKSPMKHDHLILGFLHLVVNNLDKAYRHLTEVIQINEIVSKPDHYIEYYLRSFINTEINKNRIDDAKEAVILNPNERTFLSLGNKYFENGYKNEMHHDRSLSFSKAIQSFQNSLTFNKNYVLARFQLAKVFNLKISYDQAYDELKKCIEIEPENSIYYLEIVRTLSKMTSSSKLSKREKAFDYLFQGLKIDGENPLFHLELGKLYKRANNYEEAISHYENYLKKAGFEKKNISLRHNLEEEHKSTDGNKQLSEPERISNLLASLKEKKLIRDADTFLEKGKVAKALNIYNELIKTYFNFKVYIESEDLEVAAKYFKCKVLSKNKDFQLDHDHPKYKWLENDGDASKYHHSKYETHFEAKIMGFVNFDGYVAHAYAESQFSFGKYEGIDLKTVVEKDLNYIIWCYFNIPSFFIVDLIRIEDRLRNLKDYQKLLEIHLIKDDYLFPFYDYEEENYRRQHISLEDALGRGEAGIAYWNTH